MSAPFSRASFVLSDTRMGGNLRIIAWFWMVFSGGARAAIGSGRTVSQEPVRPARRLWQVVIGNRQFRRWTLAGLWVDILDTARTTRGSRPTSCRWSTSNRSGASGPGETCEGDRRRSSCGGRKRGIADKRLLTLLTRCERTERCVRLSTWSPRLCATWGSGASTSSGIAVGSRQQNRRQFPWLHPHMVTPSVNMTRDNRRLHHAPP